MKKKDGQKRDLDFNAASQLQQALQSPERRNIWGITIDSAKTRLLDDGIFITRLDDGWKVSVSIADVPALIPANSQIEHDARTIQYERKGADGVVRIFPNGFLLNYVSLQQGEKRPAVTFDVTLDNHLNIRDYDIRRTIFLNKMQCNEGDIRQELKNKNPEVEEWVGLGLQLRAKRTREFSESCDGLVARDKAADLKVTEHDQVPSEHVANVLVQELMRLANTAATRFYKKNNLSAPLKPLWGEVDVVLVTPDYAFDQVCNKLAWNVLNDLGARTEPLAQVTSPMRAYKQYLSLKIICRQLEGLSAQPSTNRQTAQITDHFNRRAAAFQSPLLTEQWFEDWRYRRYNQNHNIHHAVHADKTSYTARLKHLCREAGWPYPLHAERLLLAGGYRATLIALNVSRPGAGRADEQSWAVHENADTALEMAAARMLKKIAPAIWAQGDHLSVSEQKGSTPPAGPTAP